MAGYLWSQKEISDTNFGTCFKDYGLNGMDNGFIVVILVRLLVMMRTLVVVNVLKHR
jgi:hypothetical protein